MANKIVSFQNINLPEVSISNENPKPLYELKKLLEKSDLETKDISLFSDVASQSDNLIEPYSLFGDNKIKSASIEKKDFKLGGAPDSGHEPYPAPSFHEVKKGSFMDQGQQGSSVNELQKRLSKVGFPVKETGEFDKNTVKVLKEFQKRYWLAETGKFGLTTLTALESAEKAFPIGKKLADRAKKEAKSRNTFGKCYNAVYTSICKQFGYFLTGYSAYMAAGQFARHPKFKELKVNNNELTKLPAGSIVVWGKTKRSPHGHISIALGDGREASDHISRQLNNLRGYKNCRVFLPVKA